MAISSPCGKWTTIRLGRLPVAAINKYLGLTLVPGNVVFFWKAQEHSFTKEPHREPICSPHYADVITNPTHVGQQPKHKKKGKDEGFDLCRKISPTGLIILMAIKMTPLKSGVYVVRSSYPLPLDTLERRVRIKTTFEI